MMIGLFLIILVSAVSVMSESRPIFTSWLTSSGNITGYGGITANVYDIAYDSNYVYISSNSIPSYSIGLWSKNPNTPSAQKVTYKFRINPSKAVTQTTVGLGNCGLWKDGVGIYNPNDGQSYNNASVWFRNAYFYEGGSFDKCNGHPDQRGNYHNHVNPVCISGYNTSDSSKHSPLLGFFFDSYPIYGPFGYSSANDSSSSIKRMKSGYSLRTNMTFRTTTPSGVVTSSAGPNVNASFPLGAFLYDYIWSASTGDLDASNGRWCVTPEYPSGTYAYFVTQDDNGNATYPFTIGPTYYGVVASTRPTSVPSTASNYY